MTDNLTSDIRSFRCQMGYYGYRALYLFEDILRELATSGRDVHLVFGSNHASLIQSHLEWTHEILQGAANTSITVVSYSNAEFHPKTMHIERADGSAVAIVGSANLTEHGLGINVEAGISIDSEDDSPEVLAQIAAAIDRWRTVDADGVFHIEEADDILALKHAKIIDEPQPTAPVPGEGREEEEDAPDLTPGRRDRLWHPARVPPPPAGTRTAVRPAGGRPAVAPAAIVAPLPALRWCKELRSSDAQWVRAGTNPTGKLRLSQAGQAIDHRRFFRYQLFGQLPWMTEARARNDYEVTQVPFDVTIDGNHLGRRVLTVDHAWHREADQDNVPTVLAWGAEINGMLTSRSHIGEWVVIERDVNGDYSLTIQATRPAWA